MWSRLRVGRRPAGVALWALLPLLVCAAPAPAAPPVPAPQALRIVHVDARTLDLAWDAPADVTLEPEILISVPGTAELSGAYRVTAATTTWSEEISCGLTYAVLVRFLRGDSEVGPWASLGFDSPDCDPGPPPPPSGLSVTGITGGQFDIAWDLPAANDIASTEVTVKAPGQSPLGPGGPLRWDRTGFVQQRLSCGTDYAIEVAFVDFDGQRSSSSITARTTECGPPPPAPADLRLIGALQAGSPAVAAAAWSWLPGVAVTWVVVKYDNGTLTVENPGDPGRWDGIRCGATTVTVSRLMMDGRTSLPATIPVSCAGLAQAGPKAPGPPASAAPPTRLSRDILLRLPAQRRAIKLDPGGRFALTGAYVRCGDAGGTCTVRIRTRQQGRSGPGIVLGSATVALAEGGRATLRGRLTSFGADRLLHRGRLRITVDVDVEQGIANDTATVSATLTAPKRRSAR